MDQEKPSLDDLRIERGGKKAGSQKGLGWAVVLIVLLVLAAGVLWWLKQPKTLIVKTAIAHENRAATGERTVLNASGDCSLAAASPMAE